MLSTEKLALAKKSLVVVLAVTLLSLGLYLVLSKTMGTKTLNAKDAKEFSKQLSEVVPEEAKDRVFINEDGERKGNSFISTVYVVEDKGHGAEVVKAIPKYLSSAQKMLNTQNLPISAVVYGVLVRPKGVTDCNVNKDKEKLCPQYRVIVGREILMSAEMAKVLSSGEDNQLYAWLTSNCPKTSAKDLFKYCDISSSLQSK